MKSEAGEARYTARSPISRTSPTLPIGIGAIICSRVIDQDVDFLEVSDGLHHHPVNLVRLFLIYD